MTQPLLRRRLEPSPVPATSANSPAALGMSREGLYKALSGDGNPSFATIMKVAKALGLKLHFESVA